jgi:hypothetical protein
MDPFDRRDRDEDLRQNSQPNYNQEGLKFKAEELQLGGEGIWIPLHVKMGGHLSRGDIPKPHRLDDAHQKHEDKKDSSKTHADLSVQARKWAGLKTRFDLIT